MYELILIDADETLFDYQQAEYQALKTALANQGITDNFQAILDKYKVLNLNLWQMLEKGEVTKDELRTRRFHHLKEVFRFDYVVETVSSDYLKQLGEGNYLIEGAEELCSYLHSNYKLVIVTNGMKEVQESRLNKSKIKPYIDLIVTSEGAKVNKPDPRIFEYTVQKVKHRNKDSILMIGDSLTADIRGGLNYGIDTCWFNPKKLKNDSETRPTYEVHALEEIIEQVKL